MASERVNGRGEVSPFWDDPRQADIESLTMMVNGLFHDMPGEIILAKNISIGKYAQCAIKFSVEAAATPEGLVILEPEEAFLLHDTFGHFSQPDRQAAINFYQANTNFTNLIVETDNDKIGFRHLHNGEATFEHFDKRLAERVAGGKVSNARLKIASLFIDMLCLPRDEETDEIVFKKLVSEFKWPGKSLSQEVEPSGPRFDILLDATDETKQRLHVAAKKALDTWEEEATFVYTRTVGVDGHKITIKSSSPVLEADQGNPCIEIEYEYPAAEDSRFDTLQGYLRVGGSERPVWYEIGQYDTRKRQSAILQEAVMAGSIDLTDQLAKLKGVADSNTARLERARQDVELGYAGLCQGGLQKVIHLMREAKA